MRPYRIKTIRALDRGLEVLEALQHARAASLHDLHLATSLPKATLTRILTTMEARGLVWQRLADGAFLPSHTVLPRAPQLRDEAHLVEVASSVLEQLSSRVKWPSVLAVPRLTYMEVLETNRPRSYFSHIPVGPVGAHVDMLRSSIGRAYLAFCGEPERQVVLQRLRAVNVEDQRYCRPTVLETLLAQTRAMGYGHRHADSGGHYNWGRGELSDGRDSIAVPVTVDGDVVAVVNLTWLCKSAKVDAIVGAYLETLKTAAAEIAAGLMR